MPNVPDDVPEYTGHGVMPSPQRQPLAPVSLPNQSRGGKQWSPLAHRNGDFPEFKGITELVLEAGIMVFPGDQTSPAHSAGGRAWGPSCMLGQLPYHSHLKICDGGGYLQTLGIFSPTPYSRVWELSWFHAAGEALQDWHRRQDAAKDKQPDCFGMLFPSILKQIQTASELGSSGESSACSERSGIAQVSFVCCPPSVMTTVCYQETMH